MLQILKKEQMYINPFQRAFSEGDGALDTPPEGTPTFTRSETLKKFQYIINLSINRFNTILFQNIKRDDNSPQKSMMNMSSENFNESFSNGENGQRNEATDILFLLLERINLKF